MTVRGRNGSVCSLACLAPAPHLADPEALSVKPHPDTHRDDDAEAPSSSISRLMSTRTKTRRKKRERRALSPTVSLSRSLSLGGDIGPTSHRSPHTAPQTISSSNAKRGGIGTARSVRQAPPKATMPISPRATLTATRRTAGSTGGGWLRRTRRRPSWPPS